MAARTLGAGRWATFLTVSLPLARRGLVAGWVLAFARSLGEFGATIMVAGNIEGQTRTIPLAVYTLANQSGEMGQAWRLVTLSILLSCAPWHSANCWNGGRLRMSVLSFRCQHRYATGFDLDVSFEITCRFTSLFGPSGSGKTSILSVIAGLLRPSQAEVRLNGRTLLDTARKVSLTPPRRNVGVVFQDALLFPHLTVRDNLQYGRRHRRHPRRTVDFARVVEVLELGALLPRYPRGLSGGEKQRVALGRAAPERSRNADPRRAARLARRSP